MSTSTISAGDADGIGSATGGGGVLRDADVLSFVEQEELVIFDDLDQLLGVLRVGGVTGLLQSVGPAFIIRGVEFEQVLVPGRFVQELGMIPVRFLDRRVFAETFVRGVVGMRDGLPCPVAFALDAEMVVGLAGQTAVAVVRFEQRLGQFDARRDAVNIHLFDRQRFILQDIGLAGQFLLSFG